MRASSVYHPAAMTYVIAEPCIGVKDASCVDVCPVDCIHTTDEAPLYYIDPDECIDCGACEPECPVTAIFAEDALPEKWNNFIQINADFFKH
jgi:NAD-dependent dihydropyrimidine dehydrogenase PreA subunit